MQTLTATYARSDFFEMIKSAVKKHEIYHITHREGSVVLMSEEEYESLIETLYLLSAPNLKKRLKRSLLQMKKGETFSLDEVL
jgi:antitoxin YefM